MKVQQIHLQIFLLLIFLGISCNNHSEIILLDKEVETIDGTVIHPQKKKKVLFFLNPECPMTENYTLEMNYIFREFSDKGYSFYGIFPGESYSRAKVEEFRRKYKITFPLISDKEFEITKFLDATITPEAYVLDEKNRIHYSGAIDNWAISLGQKRKAPTEHYLKDALNTLLQGKKADPDRTSAIGCLIE